MGRTVNVPGCCASGTRNSIFIFNYESERFEMLSCDVGFDPCAGNTFLFFSWNISGDSL